jgi:hypothetical protein
MVDPQKIKPKYWVVHDVTTSDVFIYTACKNTHDAIMQYERIAGEGSFFDNPNLACGLIEINMVWCDGPYCKF